MHSMNLLLLYYLEWLFQQDSQLSQELESIPFLYTFPLLQATVGKESHYISDLELIRLSIQSAC